MSTATHTREVLLHPVDGLRVGREWSPNDGLARPGDLRETLDVLDDFGHDLSSRASVSDNDDILALERDALIPFGRVKDGSLEVVDVERREVGVRKTSNSSDEDIAGANTFSSSLGVLHLERPESSLARVGRLGAECVEDDVLDVEFALDRVAVGL